MAGLFGGGVSQTAPRIASLQITTSCWGRPIPIAYGQCRVAGNMIWQGDFKAIANTGSSGGKGGAPKSISYTYQTAIVMALCEGIIYNVLNTWDGRAIHGVGDSGVYPPWIDEYGNPLASGNALGDFGLTLFNGGGGQLPWIYTTLNHPTQALGYNGLAYLAAAVYALDTSGNMPQQSYEILTNLNGSTGVLVPDAAIEEVFNDLLTNALYGAGFPSAQIGSLTAMRTYCIAQGLWVSPVYVDAVRGADVLKNLMLIANCGAFFSEGLVKVVPYGEQAITANGVTYTPVTTVQYSLTDDDFLPGKNDDPVTVDRASPVVSYNAVQVRFRDRSNQYNDSIAEKKDDASIALNGLRLANDVDCPEICDPNVAHTLAQILVQRYVYLRNTYKFTLGMKYMLLEPMDIVELTDGTGAGLTLQPVRITSVTENEDNTLDFEAEDYLGTVCSAPLYNYQLPGGYSANYNTDPGNVATPTIFEPPARLTYSGQSEVWIALSGNPTTWAGATIWESITGNSYKIAKVEEGRARYGVSTTFLPLTADPDTTDSLGVDLTISGGALLSATQAECDALQTICLIDNEVIGYETATLTATNKYTLGTRLRRGLFGTTVAQHQIGARFVRLDSAIVPIPYDPSLIGSIVHFKFTSFNIYNSGEQGLGAVTDYPYQLQGPPGGPLIQPSGGWVSKGSQSLAGNTIFKDFGAAAAFDSITYSSVGYQNGGVVSGQVVQTVSTSVVIGLSSAPQNATAPNTGAVIDFAIGLIGSFLGGAPVIFIFEDGVQVTIPTANFGTFKISDTVKVSSDGRNVTYFINDTPLRSVSAAGLTLHGAVCLYEPEAAIGAVQFSTGSPSSIEAGNFLSTLGWEIGTFGGQQNYIDNFDGAHNDSTVVLGGTTAAPFAGPSGSSEVLWRCTGNGSAQNGGWSDTGDLQGLDPTKTYRTSVWVYRVGINGHFLFGADLSGATSSSPGVPDTTNATFLNVPLTNFNAGEWYLAIGVIHGANYAGTALGVAGLYRQLTGQQVIAGTEYQQTPGFTYQTQRAQLNSANDPATFLYLTKPRFEEVNGAEPTILSMMGKAGTALISQNGATELFESYVPGGTLTPTPPDTNVHYESAAPLLQFNAGVLPPFDCTVIVTLVIQVYLTVAHGGKVTLWLGWGDAQQVLSDIPADFVLSGQSVLLNSSDTSATYPLVYTVQWQFQHSAANVNGSTLGLLYQTTDTINRWGSPSASVGAGMTVQAEFILR